MSSLAALYSPALVTITLGAFALRLVLLDRFPFREDEAAYAYWALHGWLEDPLYLQVWPDKPPIFLWLLGGAFRLFGVSEASARWLNVAASTLTVPLMAATARRLWGRRAALSAAALLALSPYAVSFAPTAYTDPVLVLAGTAALCASVYGRGLWAGVFLGAAVMTKQQGMLYVPLVVAALWLRETMHQHGELARRYIFLAVGAAVVVLPILYWDSLRWAVAPSPWDLSVRNYAVLALLPPTQWPARAVEWMPLLHNLTASWTMWVALASLVAGALAASFRQHGNWRDAAQGNTFVALILCWSAAFVALHITTTVQPWDRYLLPLAPVLALIAGWAVHEVGRHVSTGKLAVAGMAGVLILAQPALDAAQGRLPMGGDHGDYAGLTEAIGVVKQASQQPLVLYHQALGSHFRLYLFEQTRNDTSQHRTELRWFPSTVYLADNAAKTPYPRKFLIVPDWSPLPSFEAQLAMRNLALQELARHGHFTVWEITRQPEGPCDWCISRPPVTWHVRSVAQDQISMPPP